MMSLESNASLLIGGLLLALILAGCFVLVGLDKLNAETMMAVVVGPLVGFIGGHIAGTKGVQQGAEATVNPPPDA